MKVIFAMNTFVFYDTLPIHFTIVLAKKSCLPHIMLAVDCNPEPPCTASRRRRGTHGHYNTIATRRAYFMPENNLLDNSNSALGALGRSPDILAAQE